MSLRCIFKRGLFNYEQLQRLHGLRHQCIEFKLFGSSVKFENARLDDEKEGHYLSTLNRETEGLYGPIRDRQECRKKSHLVGEDVENAKVAEPQKRTNAATSGQQKLGRTPVDNELSSSAAVKKPRLGRNVSFPLTISNEFKTDSGDSGKALSSLAKRVLLIDDEESLDVNAAKASVTSILQKTMSPESAAALERWRQQMIRELGMRGFAKYQQDLFATGKSFHEEIKEFLTTRKDSQRASNTEKYWASILNVFDEITDVSFVEEKVSHVYLNYHGIADCVAKYKGQQVLIEWKTSQKQKPLFKDTYDNSVQVAAYMGALNSQHKLKTQLDVGLIVIAYSDGQPAHVHTMSKSVTENAWNLWLTRLHQFYVFQNKRNADAT